MTYEELIAGMDKWEAVFHAIGWGIDIDKHTCFGCPLADNNSHCTGKHRNYGELHCRKVFEEWKKSEVK